MATRLPGWLRQHLAAARVLLVLTVLLGIAYPLAVTAVAQLPGVWAKADGSMVDGPHGTVGTTPRAAGSASWASPGSTSCSSTWRWTGSPRPERADRRRHYARPHSGTGNTIRTVVP